MIDKKYIRMLFVLAVVSVTLILFSSSVQAVMYLPNSFINWNLSTTNTMYASNSAPGYVKRTIQPVSGTFFKIVKDAWGPLANEWSAGYWINSFNKIWNIPRNDQGNSQNGKFTNYPFVNPYIIVTSLSVPSATTQAFGFMTTSSNPVMMTSVTDNSSGNVTLTNNVRVRISLNTGKCSKEKIYLRYTSDGWSSDSFILASSSNTTMYTCRIPAQNKICTISYYVLTTTTNWSSGNDLDNYPDLMSININNHGGANYSYQVRGIRTIDGDPSDWTGTPGSITNSSVVSSGEWIWTDASDDIRKNITYANGSNNYELTEFRITSDTKYIYFLVRMKDITTGFPYVGIAIDTNKIPSSGQEWFGDLSDTKVATNAFWERELVLPNGNVRYYKPDWAKITNVGTKSMSASSNCIEAAISWSNLGITNGGSYRFTVMVAQDSNGYTIDRYGSDAMDCITPMPGETWNEVGPSATDGTIHFYFDVNFNKTGGVAPDNNAPAPVNTLYPKNVKVSGYYPAFRWNKPTDADGDNIPAYLFQISEYSNFTTSMEYKTCYSTNFNLATGLQDNKIYYWRVIGYDEHGRRGSWSTVTSFTSPRSFKTIDGEAGDWYGTALSQPDTAVISSNEWIWKDKTGDERNDFDQANLGNYDMTEARITFDSNDIYFLFRFQDINDIAKPYVSILISTNQIGGMNWMADESGILVGGDYGKAPANTHYGLYNVIIHDVGTGITKIEIFSNNGTLWYAPPTDGPDSCYVNPTGNIIEAKIARQDLRLKGNKKIRMSFAFCKNNPGWANSVDSTYTYSVCDAVDTISIPRFLTNDKYDDRSAWEEEISDGDIDFWAELKVKQNGTITNLIPGGTSGQSPTNNAANVSLTPGLSWKKIIDPDDMTTSYLLELSSVTNLGSTVLLRVNLTNTNYAVTSVLPDGLTYYWRVRARDRQGVLSTNVPVWNFTTIATQQIPPATTPPFTPAMDGIKDPGWGPTAFSLSPQSNLPYNYAEDMYVSNDPDYLYIGWKMHKDPWDESGSGYDKSAHWGFVFEARNDPFGGVDDPFVSGGTTKVSWLMKPDLWVEGWIKTGLSAFGKFIKYQWNENKIGWDESYLENNLDYGIKTNSWGEFKIPLTELGAGLGDRVSMLWYFRPAEDKPGVSDSVPYDASCNDYGDSASTLTTRALYRVQYAFVNTWHYPDREEVAGLGKMRTPVSPTSSDKVRISIGVYPYDGYDTALLYYTTNNWASTNKAGFEELHRSANNMYLKSEIGPFPKYKTVKYYTAVMRNGMTTYDFGSDIVSTVTSNQAQARQNAYAFLSGNSAPLSPNVDLSPQYVFTNSKITATITAATDMDSDPLTCYFQWYRNNVRQTNLDLMDTTKPFQSAISNLRSGETWYCMVRLFDGYRYSDPVTSSSVPVLLNQWTEGILLRTNSSCMTNHEFIWYDRINDVRDDVSLDDAKNYDLTEFHVKNDSQFIYFFFRLNEILEDYRIGLAMSINTNQSSGKNEIGNQMNLTLGSNYHGTLSERLANLNLLFHSIMIGSPRVEMKKENDPGWTLLSSSNAVFNIYQNAGFAEARIKRSLLGLGTGRTARISLVAYKDYVGKANEVDSSIDFTGNDGLDTISIGISRNSNLINYAGLISAYEEELSDNKMDFWFDVDMAMTNTPPGLVTGHNPTNNAVLNTLTPALSWSNINSQDITGYYLEISLNSNTFLYKVNVRSNAFTVPVNLNFGYTNYYWTVRARDKAGALSSTAVKKKFKVNISAPSSSVVFDNLNLDNYGNFSGSEDADGNVVLTWPPSLDPSGISNYFLCVGTTLGGTEITNDMKLPGTRTSYTLFNLARGSTYYAKVKAENKLNVKGDYGPSSDGIYVSRITIDSNMSDWPDKNPGNNKTYVTNGTGIWQDALLDMRNNFTNMDLEKFKVTFDHYNLYLYFKFNSAKPWPDGKHFIQVALDNDSYSATRPFIGRNVPTADLYVTSEACWEYLIKIISGPSFDTCYACDYLFGNWKKGAYKENAGSRAIECAVPLDKIGGPNRFFNRKVRFSVAIFTNSSGNVGVVDGDTTPDAVDVISTNTGAFATWNAISSQVLNYYLECNLDADGNVYSLTGVPVIYTQPPSYPTVGAGSAGWIQNAIIYFLFVDRFYNGDPSNDVTGSTKRKGGDFKGIMDNMDYIRGLNINCVYMAPPMKFGEGGAAGYNTYDWWNVDDHFGSDTDFKNLVKTLRTSGIDTIIDWPGTAIGGGPVVDSNPNWAGLYKSPWGGWPEWTVGMAEVQQYFSDALTHWACKGVRGFRLDYAKFDGNPVDHGHQYWQYVRSHLKAKFPDRYMYGEVFDTAYKISTYTWSGYELDGAFDFPLEEYGSGGIIKWGLQQTIDSGTFWNEIQNAENTYGNNPVMVSFLDNHDKDRALLRAGGDSWKVRVSLGFSLTWHEPTSLFYGTEMGMNGNRIGTDLDNSPCIDMMWGLNPANTPWWGGYNYAQYSYIKRLLAGKRSFPGLRSGNIGVNMRYASGQWLIYERNYYNDAILVILNRSSSAASAPTGSFTTWASRTWRDWMNGSDYFTTGANGMFTNGISVNGNDCRVLVSRELGSGGFGECSIWGLVNVPDAIVRIKDYAGTIYERTVQADDNGNYSLNNVVCLDTGNENRTVEAWAPGYNISYPSVTVWDTGSHNLNINLTPDTTPPDSPKGVSVRPGDKITELTWTKNSETDLGSYLVYRSETEEGEYTRLDEVLDSAYMDNTVENDKTYYYKVRARDINGNMSGFSRSVSAFVDPIDVCFWINLNSSGYNNIQKVLIRGNSEKMNFWGVIGDDPEMESAGNGWYKITYKFDPRMGIMYKYKLLENGNWHEEMNFSGDGSWYGNRYVDFKDQGNRRMNIYNRWNTLGDSAPQRPGNLSASPGDRQVSLSWDRNIEMDVKYYSLYRRIGLAGSFSNIASISYQYNTFMDKNVVNGTTYYYYVNAIDENNQTSENSRTNSATPTVNDTIPPSRPSGLSIYAFSTNQFRLSWNANNEPDLSGYHIYRSNSGTAWARLNINLITVSSNPYYLDAVLPGIEYSYRVNAVDDSTNANVSSNSPMTSGELIRVNFKVDMGNITCSSVRITGTQPPFFAGGLAMDKVSEMVWSRNLGLMAKSTYLYKYMFNATNQEDHFNSGQTAREITVSATNGINILQFDDWEEQPGIPQNVWVFPKNQKVEVHWDKVTGSEDLIGYNLYYSTNATAKFENMVNETVITGNSYLVGGLENNRKYYFVVRSMDGGVIQLESPDSTVVSATPRKSVPVYFRTMRDTEGYLVGIR